MYIDQERSSSNSNSNMMINPMHVEGHDVTSVTTDGGARTSARATHIQLRKQFYNGQPNFNGVSMEDIRKEGSEDRDTPRVEIQS